MIKRCSIEALRLRLCVTWTQTGHDCFRPSYYKPMHSRLSSTAKFMFGMTLRIAGEFVFSDAFTPNPYVFIEEFHEHMHKVKPVSNKAYI